MKYGVTKLCYGMVRYVNFLLASTVRTHTLYNVVLRILCLFLCACMHLRACVGNIFTGKHMNTLQTLFF